MMHDDPFMPATRRFPRDVWPIPDSSEKPSDARPFVLRGALVDDVQVPEAKHRTPKTRSPVTNTTTFDGKDGPQTKPDTHYVPDE